MGNTNKSSYKNNEAKPKDYNDIKIENLAIDSIKVRDWYIRKYDKSDPDVEYQAKSIENNTLQEPIIVHEDEPGVYSLLHGLKRLLACLLLGWDKIPAIIKTGLTEQQKMLFALIANVDRTDLLPLQKAEYLLFLWQTLKLKTQKEMADLLNRSEGWVSLQLDLLKLPQYIKDRVRNSKFYSFRMLHALSKMAESEAIEQFEKYEKKRLEQEKDENLRNDGLKRIKQRDPAEAVKSRIAHYEKLAATFAKRYGDKLQPTPEEKDGIDKLIKVLVEISSSSPQDTPESPVTGDIAAAQPENSVTTNEQNDAEAA